MKDLDKILAKAKNAKAKDRLLDTKEVGQIIAKTNFSPTKGTIMKLTAIFIPILAATIWVASMAGSNRPDEQKAIENIQNLENAIDLSGDAKYKRLVPILHLTPEELKEIGIVYSPADSSYYIEIESYDNKTRLSSGKKMMDSLGYDVSENFIYRSVDRFGITANSDDDERIFPYSEYINHERKGISPIELRMRYIKFKDNDFIDTTGYGTAINACGYSPLIDSWDWSQASEGTDKFHTTEFGYHNYDLFKQDYLIIDAKEYDVVSQLIPVELPFDIPRFKVQAVAYFVPTPKFVSKLPTRYQEIIKQNYELTEVLDLDDVDYDEQVTVDQLNFDYSVAGDTLILTDSENPIYLPILKLNDKQLLELGIQKSDDNYIVPMEKVDYSSYSWQKEKMKELGYEGVNFTVRELAEFGIDSDKDDRVLSKEEYDNDPKKGIYPFKLKLEYGEKGEKKTKGTKSRSPIPPNIDEKDGGLFASNINELFKKITETGKEIKNFKYVAIDPDENYAVSKLVPIVLPLEDEDYWVNSLAFYVPTPKLVENLPKKYQEIVKEKYEITDFLDIDNSKIVYAADKEAIKLDKTISLQGINYIELKEDELGSLMGEQRSDSIFIPHLMSYNLDDPFDEEMHKMVIQKFIANGLDTNLRDAYIHAKTLITHSEMETGSMSYGIEWRNDIVPTPVYKYLVTNIMDEGVIKHMTQINSWTSGHTYLEKDSASKKAFSNLVDNYNKIDDSQSKRDLVYSLDENGDPIIKSLLPVRLNIGDKESLKEGEKHTEITLWYVPTPDFITSLPARYAEPLMKEFDIAASVEAGEMTISEACEELGGTSYLGICPNGSFALMNMYPLPARNNINLLIVSEKQKAVSANIYDINGTLVAELGKINLIGGKNTPNIDLSKINSGTYILSLVDDKENAVNRTFLKK
jgi:hypothetical protein